MQLKNKINNINFLSEKWYEALDLDNNFLNKFDIDGWKLSLYRS